MRIPLSPRAAAFAATALLLPLAANAQGQTAAPPPSPMPAPSAGQSTISDQQISKAANAMQHVMTLRQNYEQRMAQAQPEQRAGIAQEGHAAVVKAVTDQGLTVQQYNNILQTAQNDPNVRAKLLSKVTPPTPTGGTGSGTPPASSQGQ